MSCPWYLWLLFAAQVALVWWILELYKERIVAWIVRVKEALGPETAYSETAYCGHCLKEIPLTWEDGQRVLAVHDDEHGYECGGSHAVLGYVPRAGGLERL